MGRRRRKYARRTSALENLFLFIFAVVLGFQILTSAVERLMLYLKNKLLMISMYEWLLLGLIVLFVLMIAYTVKSGRSAKLRNETEQYNFQANIRKKTRIINDGEVQKLKSMDPTEFEKYIADLFSLKGYQAEVTKRTGDGGKDVILRKGEELKIVECKRYNAPKVSRPDIQKFHSAIMDTKAQEGFYVTTGYFTQPAIEYALDKPIQLIDLPRLLEMIEEINSNPT
jgi:HJR/Mrr/RecB family endonuclease